MSDLISRQAAIDRINKQREHLQPDVYPQDEIGDAAYRICSEFIERLPSTERKGKWMRHPNYKDKYFREWDVCSVCGTGCHRRIYEIINGNEFETIYGFSYCPNCGARMVRGEEDERQDESI